MRPLFVLATLVLLVTGGFRSYLEHMVSGDHPWHAGPAAGTFFVVAAPVLPVALVEEVLTGQSFHGGGVTTYLMAPACAAGLAVGTVTYLTFFPLEFAFPLEEKKRKPTPGEDPAGDPADSDSDSDPLPEPTHDE